MRHYWIWQLLLTSSGWWGPATGSGAWWPPVWQTSHLFLSHQDLDGFLFSFKQYTGQWILSTWWTTLIYGHLKFSHYGTWSLAPFHSPFHSLVKESTPHERQEQLALQVKRSQGERYSPSFSTPFNRQVRLLKLNPGIRFCPPVECIRSGSLALNLMAQDHDQWSMARVLDSESHGPGPWLNLMARVPDWISFFAHQ